MSTVRYGSMMSSTKCTLTKLHRSSILVFFSPPFYVRTPAETTTSPTASSSSSSGTKSERGLLPALLAARAVRGSGAAATVVHAKSMTITTTLILTEVAVVGVVGTIFCAPPPGGEDYTRHRPLGVVRAGGRSGCFGRTGKTEQVCKTLKNPFAADLM